MTKEEFARGLQLINAVTSNQNQILEVSTIETYFLLLQDLDPKIYLDAVISLLKEKVNMYNPPSPGEIIKYYNLEKKKSLNTTDVYLILKRDSVILGKNNKPKYIPEIESVIYKLGGWENLCLNMFNEEQIESILLKNSNKLDLISN